MMQVCLANPVTYMPTSVPRITVALPSTELRDLDEVARTMRKSRSATAAMIVEGALPFLLDLSRAAGSSRDPAAVRAAILNVMTSGLTEVNEAISTLSSSSVEAVSPGETGGARMTGRAGPRPPRRTRRATRSPRA